MNKLLFSLLLLLLLPVALLVIVTPLDSEKQYIFGLIGIGMLFLLGLNKSKKVSVIMVVMSILMSTRYIYWRATETLHFNSTIEAHRPVCGGALCLGDPAARLPANHLAAETHHRTAAG